MPVQFEEQQFSRPLPRTAQQGGVTNLILKLGLAKNVQQANLVMIIIAIVAIGIAAYLMWPESTAAPVVDPLTDPALNPAAF